MESRVNPTPMIVLRLDVDDLVFDLQNIHKFVFFQDPSQDRSLQTPTSLSSNETETSILIPLNVLATDFCHAVTAFLPAFTCDLQQENQESYSALWSKVSSSISNLRNQIQQPLWGSIVGYLRSRYQPQPTEIVPPSTEITSETPEEHSQEKTGETCTPSTLTEFELKARQFLENDQMDLVPEGVGGTYFIRDLKGEKFGIFKPVDEEPGALNNPKKLVSNPLLPPGGGAVREVAAFALDRGFAGVPPTYFIQDVQTKSGSKTGSIQQFIPNEGVSSSLGPSKFNLNDIHRIGILDIRLFNLDRNGENMLITKGEDDFEFHLVPIDHAYILPEKLDSAYFEWMYWPQAKKPFSKEVLEFIEAIDLLEDVTTLRMLGVPEASIRTMLVSTILLKHCASIGKNLFEIASLVCRDFSGKPSRLEQLVASLPNQEFESVDEVSFIQTFGHLVQDSLPSM